MVDWRCRMSAEIIGSITLLLFEMVVLLHSEDEDEKAKGKV